MIAQGPILFTLATLSLASPPFLASLQEATVSGAVRGSQALWRCSRGHWAIYDNMQERRHRGRRGARSLPMYSSGGKTDGNLFS
jgi:hypothetical protein